MQPAGPSGRPDDYRVINICFANGVTGRPPSPDNSADRIQIDYQVRRNFSTTTLVNDQIDISYSTRAIYGVSLELLPWAPYDQAAYVWNPDERIKGVQLQAHVPILLFAGSQD